MPCGTHETGLFVMSPRNLFSLRQMRMKGFQTRHNFHVNSAKLSLFQVGAVFTESKNSSHADLLIEVFIAVA